MIKVKIIGRIHEIHNHIHSSLLERCGKLKYSYFGGSITGFPVTETINSDITEYIATNVISITDGQFYTNKRLFIESSRPAIDSVLGSVDFIWFVDLEFSFNVFLVRIHFSGSFKSNE